jgi:hypothetical protein
MGTILEDGSPNEGTIHALMSNDHPEEMAVIGLI